MNISDKGLAAIERTAEKSRNAEALLLVQLIKEVRQLQKLLQEHCDACYGGNNRTDCACDSNDEHKTVV